MNKQSDEAISEILVTISATRDQPLPLRFLPVRWASVCSPGCLKRPLPGPWTSLQRPAGLAVTDPQSDWGKKEKSEKCCSDMVLPYRFDHVINTTNEIWGLPLSTDIFGFIRLRRTKVMLLNHHRGQDIIHHTDKGSSCTILKIKISTCNRDYFSYLSLAEYNVGIWSRTFVHVWFGDDEQDVLGLADGYSGNPSDLAETQLGHSLRRIETIEIKGKLINF